MSSTTSCTRFHAPSFLLGVLLTIPCLIYFWSGTDHFNFGSWPSLFSFYNNNEGVVHDDELLTLLKKASMDDNTVMLTSINEAWAAPNSLLDLFIESFRAGEEIEHLLNHFLIIAMDAKAYESCKSVHPYCYFQKTEGVDYSGEKVFMSKDYLQMMWGRNELQRKILELGFNFLFTFNYCYFVAGYRHLMVPKSNETHLSNLPFDIYHGNAEDLSNTANGGFVYARSCNETINLYKDWYEARNQFPEQHEQDVFNNVKLDLISRYHVNVRFIDTAYCGGFCEFKTDLEKMCTMHANCCIGLEKKISSLRSILDDWKKYKSLSTEEKSNGRFNLRRPQCWL